MAVNYAYYYAQIDLNTNMCINVQDTTVDCSGSADMIPLPVLDPEYLFKYYNWDDGKFYYDATYTQEFVSALL